MANGITVANANPLDSGASANSVESAAEGFTELLHEEAKPATPNRRSGQDRQDNDPLFPDTEDPDVAPKSGDGQSPKPREARKPADDDRDPILSDDVLDDSAEPKDGEDDEGENDEPDDADEPDEGDEGDDEDGDEGELDLDREVEITVAGEPVKVKLSEALAGYSREADYRQKTAALAEERREVEEYAQQVVAERQKYVESGDEFVKLAEAIMPSEAEWNALKVQNPELYIQTKEQWDGIQKKVNEAKAAKAEADAKAAEEANRQYSAWVKSQNNALLEKVPALRNPKQAQKFKETIFAYGKAAGYSEDELMTGAVDARDVLTLYKAARYDEIMRSRKTGQRPSNPGPKPSSTSQPRVVSKTKPGTARNARDADRRLQRTGSVDDAALAFTAMLKS